MSKRQDMAVTRTEEHQKPQPLRFRDREDGEFEQVTPLEEAPDAVRQMLGVPDTDTLAIRLLSQTMGVMKPLEGGVSQASDANDASALLAEIGPKDAVEGMLAVQMVGAHSAAMRCLQLASQDEQTFTGREVNFERAVKLLRVYAAQVEALNKHRNKAKQTVVVKHVHVHEGGQAIVGNVAPGEGGGGDG